MLIPLLYMFLFSCSNFDNKKVLQGKTFKIEMDNNDGLSGISVYSFDKKGNVIYSVSLYDLKTDNLNAGTLKPLKYRLDGSTLDIYYSYSNNFKKEKRGTIFKTGTYYPTYIIIDGMKHRLVQ